MVTLKYCFRGGQNDRLYSAIELALEFHELLKSHEFFSDPKRMVQPSQLSSPRPKYPNRIPRRLPRSLSNYQILGPET